MRPYCQCFFFFFAYVALSCSLSETVCAVPEAFRSRAFDRDAREFHSEMGLKVCKVAVQWICRFEQILKKHMLQSTTGILNQLDFGHFSPSVSILGWSRAGGITCMGDLNKREFSFFCC